MELGIALVAEPGDDNMIWKDEPRKSYKKEKLRIIGRETGFPDHPFVPLQTAINCPICGGKAWAKRENMTDADGKIIGSEYITYCLKGCKPVRGQVIVIDPIKVKQGGVSYEVEALSC